MVGERESGTPLEVVVGWAEFLRLRIRIDPGVFVPRRRTEFVAVVALEHLAGRAAPRVLDLCCGSGALGAAVERERPDAEVWAADIDPAATACAARNLRDASRIVTGDLVAAVPLGLRGTLDAVLVNAPYVPTDAIALMPAEARDHEPAVTLDGGADGTALHARVADEVAPWLAPGGALVVETSDEQVDLTAGHLRRAGLRVETRRDDSRNATVVVGVRRDV